MKRSLLILPSIGLLAAAASAQVATYTFNQSVGTFTPITAGTIIATATSAASQDDVTYAVTLPFAFPYNNTTMGPGTFETQVQVQTNGHLAFGSATSSTYTPLSSTTVTNGYVAGAGADLQGGYVFACTRTSGSDQVTAVSAMGPLAVGMTLVGTGIPTGTTITAISGTTLTMSALATSTSTGTAVTAYGATDIRWELQGTSPNQEFVVQWSNFKRWGTTLATTNGLYLTFQIRLREDGRVQCVYGDCSPGLSTATGVFQVGLRGPTNTFATDINSRKNVKGTSDWDTSVPTALNSEGEVFNSVAPANVISNGLTYTWDPPVAAGCTGTPTPGNTIAPADACSGANFVLSLQNATPGMGVTYQWYSSTTSAGGPWNPLGTSGTQSASQVVDSWYYCDVTCSAGPSTGSSAVAFVPMTTVAAVQDWSTGVVTPNCWSVSNPVGTYLPAYSTASGYGVGTGSAGFNFYNASNTYELVLTSPTFAAVGAGTDVYFDAAGATYTGGEIDHMLLEESNDGGTTWTLIADLTNEPVNGALNTGGATSSPFTPTAAQWTSLHYPLTAGTNRVRFHGVSNFGNVCYVDNVSIGVPPSARNTTYGGVCSGYGYAMSAAPAPVTGNTVIFNQVGIPEAAPASGVYFGVVVNSLSQLNPGIPLNVLTGGAIDSPCSLLLGSLDLLVSFVSATSTDSTVILPIPLGAPIGAEVFTQGFALIVPVAPNNAGIVTSNAVRSYINTF